MKIMFKNALILFLLSSLSTHAMAGSMELTDLETQCAIFNNNKLMTHTSCTTDAMNSGNVWGFGTVFDFHDIPKYGKITLNMHTKSQLDADGQVIFDDNGNIIHDATEYLLNDKPAIIRYRHPKTYKLLTPAQMTAFENNTLNFTPYTCLYQKDKPQFEFCFEYGFAF